MASCSALIDSDGSELDNIARLLLGKNATANTGYAAHFRVATDGLPILQ